MNDRKRDAIQLLECILHEQKAARESMDKLSARMYWLIAEMRKWYKDKTVQPALPLEVESQAEVEWNPQMKCTEIECPWVGTLEEYTTHMGTTHGLH